MSHLVQQLSHQHLDIRFLDALDRLGEAVKPSDSLFKDVLRRLTLNLKIFSQADVGTQRHLIQRLAKLCKVSHSFMILSDSLEDKYPYRHSRYGSSQIGGPEMLIVIF